MGRTVAKMAQLGERFRRPFFVYRSAREALKALLAGLHLGEKVVLLPDYVGWSSREGSGVADPLDELELSYRFYHLGPRLEIDLDSLKHELSHGDVRVVVLIHYFGYPAAGARRAVELAREKGALVVEDQAHSGLTDWVGGLTGRLGDASIYSLHKLLPMAEGGLLSIAPPLDEVIDPASQADGVQLPWNFDLHAIAKRRRANAQFLAKQLEALGSKVEPLFSPPGPGVVPQTFPVRLLSGDRDWVYGEMNSRGFGVVSLYHTLIQRIGPSDHPVTHALSRQVLNLPVHQDADEEPLKDLVRTLGLLL
jgi:dTDP-4-amino-4,6-dideoxygalactose transaminase